MRKLILFLVVLITATFSLHLNAQDYRLDDGDNLTDNKAGIGPRIGYYKAEDADDGNMFIGLQTRIRAGKVFGFEIAGEYRGKQKYTIGGGEVKITQIPVTGSILLFVPVNPHFQPYGLVGAGAYYTIYDYDGSFIDPDDDSVVNYGYHLGFGLDMPLDESVAINVDYRYLFLDGDNDDIEDKEFSGNVITVGLTFYF